MAARGLEHNRLELGGRIVHHGGLRHTPAGLPAVELNLAHVSQQAEAGHVRRVACELPAVAYGDTALALAGVREGSALVLSGFVERRSQRDDRLVLHITGFDLIEE
ncbi:MAG: primosomal replication protein N [Thiobacillaceae bacterium]|nr:primosomal replication protein N [Thiobacillaceae bacterium]MDW8324316.1 primosomal replication protein N [Burkholderiales bacterium]